MLVTDYLVLTKGGKVGYQSYKDLNIYKTSFKLAREIHEMSLSLPKFEMYEEGSQIRKSSKSIKSNIVEGFGRRRYKQDFIRFLTYSLASCDETIDHLDTLYETKSLKKTEINLNIFISAEEGTKIEKLIINVLSSQTVYYK